jgi:hypothetical protein
MPKEKLPIADVLKKNLEDINIITERRGVR